MCVCVLLCEVIWFYVVFIVCVFFTRQLHTRVCSRAATCLLPPDAPGGGGRGGWQWHKCPIVRAASLPLEETITWGHQKISYDINPASLAPPMHAHMHASARLPIIPLLQITSHCHRQLQTKQQITCVVCMQLMSASLWVLHLRLSRWQDRSYCEYYEAIW